MAKPVGEGIHPIADQIEGEHRQDGCGEVHLDDQDEEDHKDIVEGERGR